MRTPVFFFFFFSAEKFKYCAKNSTKLKAGKGPHGSV